MQSGGGRDIAPADEARGRSGRRGPSGRVGLPPGALARNTGFLIAKVAQMGRERCEQALAPMALEARHTTAF